MTTWNDGRRVTDGMRSVVVVDSSSTSYHRELAENETIAEAVEEFGDGYDFNGVDEPCVVRAYVVDEAGERVEEISATIRPDNSTEIRGS